MRRFARLLAATTAAALASAAPAPASTYEVRACDAAPGYVNNSWVAERTHGGMAVYPECPSAGLETGLVTRHVAQPEGWTVPAGAAARWFFFAPPGAAIVGIRANARFESISNRWQVGLSNGRELLAGCPWSWGSSGAVCADFLGEDEYRQVPPSSALYFETYCVVAPCPASWTSTGPGHVYARAIVSSATVTVEDGTAPTLGEPQGELWTDRWLGGRQRAVVDASDNTGIKAIRLFVDGTPKAAEARDCDPTRITCPDWPGANLPLLTSDGLTDGPHTLTLQAVDRADNTSELRREIRVDNTPPSAPEQLTVAGGEGWRSSDRLSVTWRNPPQAGTAPIAGADYELCPSEDTNGGCISGQADGRDVTTIARVPVPRPGSWTLRVWLRDEAGNAREETAALPVQVGFDPDPPALAIRPIDEEDPARVSVVADDALSGVARGEIEVRRRDADTWRDLPATLSADGFSAMIDDEHLRDGVYDVRARAIDAAGNERSSDRLVSGDVARIALPLRVKTNLRVGKVKRTRARSAGRPRVRRVLLTRPLVRRGRPVRLHGRLTAPGGNPLQGVDIEVWARLALTGSQFAPVATLKTSRTGRFSYLVPAGPSRILRFRYPGAAKIRPRAREVELRVRGASTIRASGRSVVNGEPVTFVGRLLSRPIPQGGKLMELQWFARGEWRTFRTFRAAASSGRWHYTYRFDGTRGTSRYRLRVRIPRENGYPYVVGVSRTVRVTVRGL